MKLQTNSSIQTDTHSGVKVKDFNTPLLNAPEEDPESRDDHYEDHEFDPLDDEYSALSLKSTSSSSLGLSRFASESVSDCGYIFRSAFSEDKSGLLDTFQTREASGHTSGNDAWWWRFGRQSLNVSVVDSPSLMDDEGRAVEREQRQEPEVPVGSQFQSLLSCDTEVSEVNQGEAGPEVKLDLDEQIMSNEDHSVLIDDSKVDKEKLDVEDALSEPALENQATYIKQNQPGSTVPAQSDDNQSVSGQSERSNGNESSIDSQIGQEVKIDSEEESTTYGSATSSKALAGKERSSASKKSIVAVTKKQNAGKKKSIFGRFLQSRSRLSVTAEDSAVSESSIGPNQLPLAEIRPGELVDMLPAMSPSNSKGKKTSLFRLKKSKTTKSSPESRATSPSARAERVESQIIHPVEMAPTVVSLATTDSSLRKKVSMPTKEDASLRTVATTSLEEQGGSVSTSVLSRTVQSRTLIESYDQDMDEVELRLAPTVCDTVDQNSFGNPVEIGSNSKSVIEDAEVGDNKLDLLDVTDSTKAELSSVNRTARSASPDTIRGSVGSEKSASKQSPSRSGSQQESVASKSPVKKDDVSLSPEVWSSQEHHDAAEEQAQEQKNDPECVTPADQYGAASVSATEPGACAASPEETKQESPDNTNEVVTSPADLSSPSALSDSSQSYEIPRQKVSNSFSLYGSVADHDEIQKRSTHSKHPNLDDESQLQQSPAAATLKHVGLQENVPAEVIMSAPTCDMGSTNEPTAFSILSPYTNFNESEQEARTNLSFDSEMTPEFTCSDDAKENKVGPPLLHNADIDRDEKKGHLKNKEPDIAETEQTKSGCFGFFWMQQSNSSTKKQDAIKGGENVDDSCSNVSPASVKEAVPEVNFLDAACEAAYQCICQDEFSDLLEDSMRARDLHRVKKRPTKKKKRQSKNCTNKKRPKKDNLLLPIDEESGDELKSDDKNAATNNSAVITPSSRIVIPSAPLAIKKKKKRRFFGIFRTKKKKVGKKTKDVLSLIQSDTFIVDIVNEINLDIQQSNVVKRDTKATVQNDKYQFNDDLPDGFSEMLAEQIAEEAVKIGLEGP